MQTSRIIQVVILMIVVALAASCAAGKEYSAKLFTPRNQSTEVAARTMPLRFLELDRLGGDSSQWVQTDIINGKDTTGRTLALDNLSKTMPATASKDKPLEDKKIIPVPAESEPVAKTLPATDGTRNKSTRE